MQIELTQEESNQLIECINVTIKSSSNAITTASVLIPLVVKLQGKNEEVKE